MTQTSPPVQPARPDALPALTGLRFLAAFCVLIGHCATAFLRFSGAEPRWCYDIAQLPAIGMPLFFVLSGFVIHYNYHRSIVASPARGTLNFFIARFARLYPLYILLVGLDLLRFGYFENPATADRLWSALPSYLALVQSWHYQIIGDQTLGVVFPAMTQVTWSVSTEWFFYLVYPVACIALARLRGIKAIVLAIAGVTVAGYVSVICAAANLGALDAFGADHYGSIAGLGATATSFRFWLLYLSPYPRLFEFALGCLSAALFVASRNIPVSRREARLGAGGLAVAIGGMIVAFVVLVDPEAQSDIVRVLGMYFGFAPFIAVLLFCCTRYTTPVSAALSRPWIVLCGEISYSIYLLHIGFVQYADLFDELAGSATPTYTGWHILHALVTIAIVSLTVIGLSLVTYSIIEVPARRRLRQWLTLPSPRVRTEPDHSVVEP